MRIWEDKVWSERTGYIYLYRLQETKRRLEPYVHLQSTNSRKEPGEELDKFYESVEGRRYTTNIRENDHQKP